MKVDNTPVGRVYQTYAPVPADEESSSPAAEPRENINDLAAVFERSGRSEKAAKTKKEGPSDISAALTRRLVTAKYQGEIYSIISEAYKNLAEWLQAAAGGDGKAMAAIKRLNKLIRRANRKIGDLNKEDMIRQDQKRAERAEQENIARRLRIELKRRMIERKQREQKYLQDARPQKDQKQPISGPSIAELEARIMALAQAMTQMSAGAGMDSGGGSVSVAGGGETAAAEAEAPAAE